MLNLTLTDVCCGSDHWRVSRGICPYTRPYIRVRSIGAQQSLAKWMPRSVKHAKHWTFRKTIFAAANEFVWAPPVLPTHWYDFSHISRSLNFIWAHPFALYMGVHSICTICIYGRALFAQCMGAPFLPIHVGAPLCPPPLTCRNPRCTPSLAAMHVRMADQQNVAWTLRRRPATDP